MTPIPSFRDAISAMEARGFGIKPGLERMEQLVRLLDNPQLTYPTIHITGTNGKTSTARILGVILAAHGLKTGVYTSPHLETVRERFLLIGLEEGRIVSDIISEGDLAATLSYLAPFVEMVEGRERESADETGDPYSVTYFELTTLAAFEWMSDNAVGAGIFEAGMGGKWDATNVIEAGVAILCPIHVDHTDYLGKTPLENASEKVGIVKMGATVVSAPQLREVADLISRTAAAAEATVSTLGREFRIEQDQPGVAGRVVSIASQYASYKDLYLPMYGAHQAENLALAIAAAESFREEPLDDQALRSALGSLQIPGRLEVVGRKPLVLLDGAHNPSAARALAAALRESFGSLSICMVVSIFADKDAAGILEHLAPLAERLILTRSSSPRAADPQDLVSSLSAGPSPELIEPLERAIDAALAGTPQEDMVLVTGSLYGVGEAKTYLSRSNLPGRIGQN